MEQVLTLMTEIGKIFLSNTQINGKIVHIHIDNLMIIGYQVGERSIKQNFNKIHNVQTP